MRGRTELRAWKHVSECPLQVALAAADRTRELARTGRAGVRYVLSTEAAPRARNESLQRSAMFNRRRELSERVHAYLQTRPGGGFARRAA